MMRIDILTLFPEMIEPIIKESIIGKAIKENKIEIHVINFRDFSNNKHNKVDDYPFGGGSGMLIGIQPIYDALQSIDKKKTTKVILTTPQGQPFNQMKAEELSQEEHLIIICGHYEGIDDRVREHLVDEEISIGDYVLTGGELPALILVDAIIRLLPEVINESSHQNDSFSTRILEHPHYTRPAEFQGMKVPDVLLSGNHKLINRYRMKESLRNTYLKRPDLLKNYSLTDKEKKLLQEIIDEEKQNNKK